MNNIIIFLGWMNLVARDLISFTSGNVVVCNWGYSSSCDYITSMLVHAPAIANYTAKLIGFMTNNGFKSINVTVIGHSMGAQIAGLIGKLMQSQNKEIGTIIGTEHNIISL